MQKCRLLYHTENNYSKSVTWPGHFMCKIDNSKAKVALDPDGIKGWPTLGGSW